MGVRWWQQATVVAFCVVLAGLVVRTHVLQDDRYGFSMFRDLWVYSLTYTWVMEDGTRKRYDTDKDLRGDARQIRATRSRDHILGLGALHDLVGGFGEWAWAERRPEGAAALEAQIRRRYYDRGPLIEETLRWP